MKRVLITGANGFVGRNVCKVMLAKGWQVRGSIRSAMDMATLPIGVEAVQIQSISLNPDWSDALNGIAAVIHLAARVHMMDEKDPDALAAYRQVNVAGTKRLALAASTAGVKRLVYLSSVKVNGEETNVSYTENDKPSPKDPYGISKWEAEQILQMISRETGLEVVIIRPPLIYGPGVKANFLRLMELVERGIPLPLRYVDNHRSLVYLGNLIDAIVTCVVHPKAGGQTYLISDGEDVSTPELITKIAAALGRPARLVPCPQSLMRFLGKLTGKSSLVERLLGSLSVDSSKIRSDLGWSPPFTMDQGLRETAGWFLK